MFWGKKNKEEKVDQNEQLAQGPLYALVLKIEGVDSQEIPVESDLLVGSSEDAQISIEGADLDDQHATFKINAEVLSVLNHTDDRSFIGEQKLQKGKNYVLNHGDNILLGGATFIVKKIGVDLIDADESVSPETKDLDAEVTAEDIQEENQTTAPAPSPVEIKDLESASKQDESSYQTSPTITAIQNTAEVKEQLRNEQKKIEEVIKQKNKEKLAIDPEKSISKRFSFMKAKPIDPSSKMNKSFTKGSFFPLDNAPRFFSRFYAVVVNIFLTYALIYTLLPIFDPQEAHAPFMANASALLFDQIKPILTIPSEFHLFVTHIVEFYIFYCALELVWAILFGVSLPFLMLGVRTEDSPFLSRFKAFFRTAIGCVTTPLIVFDLPVLVGYKSLKELITMTQLQYHSRLAKITSAFFFLPLLCLFSLFSPVLIHLEHFATVNLQLEMKEEQEQGFQKKSLIPQETVTASTASGTSETQTATPTEIIWQVRSDLFGVKSELRFSDNLIILPQSNRGIIILDKNKDSVFAEFTYKTPADFENMLLSAKAGNPLFPLLYPSLYQYMTRQDKALPPLPDAEKDLNHLFIGAQKLNTQLWAPEEWPKKLLSIATYLIEFGPFIPGYLNVRDKMIGTLQIPQGTNMAFLNQKRNDFIRFTPDTTSINYILLTTPNRPHPLLEYNASQMNGKVGLEVIRQLLNGDWRIEPMIPLTASQTEVQSPRAKMTQLEKENAFAMIDFLNFYQRNPTEASTEAGLVSTFFRNEFERARSVSPDTLLMKKFKKAVLSYAQELKRVAKPDDMNMTQVIGELEQLVKEQTEALTASGTSTATGTTTPTDTETLPTNMKGNP